MARITIEDCLENVDNRFALVMVTADRAKKLLKKDVQPLIEDHRDNREVVTALREIAQGQIQAVKAKEVVEVEVNSDAEDAANLAPILPDAAKLA
jgi:DNA-directed RNA polymerase subunit omega